MRAAGDLLSTIGNTPLVELRNLSPSGGARILVKLEGSNPGGSVKDRAAAWMVSHALKERLLKPGMVILEATSGNTGIGLAMVGAALGYRVRLVLPGSVSTERRQTLAAFGADLVTTPGALGTDGAMEEVERIRDRDPDLYFAPDQYGNRANWLSHYESTSLEILEQTGGAIHAFVAGMGTGGTLMGHSRRFAETDPSIQVIGVEPEPGHSIQGLKNMGESSVPAILDFARLSRVVRRTETESFETAAALARREGIFVGISGGATVSAALAAARDMRPGETVVALAADRGDRYLSTGLFRAGESG